MLFLCQWMALAALRSKQHHALTSCAIQLSSLPPLTSCACMLSFSHNVIMMWTTLASWRSKQELATTYIMHVQYSYNACAIQLYAILLQMLHGQKCLSNAWIFNGYLELLIFMLGKAKTSVFSLPMGDGGIPATNHLLMHRLCTNHTR